MRVPQVSGTDEFIRWEERQEQRYEFADGAISPFPGATRRHEIIVVNLLVALRRSLAANSVCGPGMKLVSDTYSRYPDVSVSFDPRDSAETTKTRYPTLLIEVLSKSSGATDRGPKADEYRTLETLREYVLIDSRKRWAQTIRRAGDAWIVSLPIRADPLRFESVSVSMTFDELYAGTEL